MFGSGFSYVYLCGSVISNTAWLSEKMKVWGAFPAMFRCWPAGGLTVRLRWSAGFDR